MKKWLLRKDPDAGGDWKQEEKGITKDEMVAWHHHFNGHEFEQALGVDVGQGSLVCCGPWGCKEVDTNERPNWLITDKNFKFYPYISRRGFPGGSVVKNLPAMQEMQIRSLVQEDPVKQEMANHSNILAWKIPWKEEPGGLQSMGYSWIFSAHFYLIKLVIDLLIIDLPSLFGWK